MRIVHDFEMSDTQPCREPIVTGTSVLAFKYKDGIIMATDNLGMFSIK